MFKKLLTFLIDLFNTDCPRCGHEMVDKRNMYWDTVCIQCKKCWYIDWYDDVDDDVDDDVEQYCR